jgi:DNA-binding winged helix-turn-helix (wHTH) protein
MLVTAKFSHQIENDIQTTAANVHNALSRSEHADELCALNETLALHDIGSTLDDSDLVDARSYLRRNVIDGIRELLLEKCDPVAAAFIALGERVDRGVRPLSVELYLYRPSRELLPQGIEWVDRTGFGRRRPDGDLNAYHHDNLLLGNTCIEAGQLPTEIDWLEQVRALWIETHVLPSIPSDAIEARSALDNLPFKEASTTHRRLLVDNLDHRIRRALKASAFHGEIGQLNETKYLGLQLLENQQVKRQGIEGAVLIPSECGWLLMKLLVRNRESVTPRSMVTDKGHSEATLYNAASELRKALEPLSLRLKTWRGTGYQLIEVSKNNKEQERKQRPNEKTPQQRKRSACNDLQ